MVKGQVMITETSSPLTLIASDTYLDSLASRLDVEGLVCVQDAISPSHLERWRGQLSLHLKAYGQRYFSIIQPWLEEGSAFQDLAQDANFRALLTGLTRRGIPGRESDDSIYNVLRVIAGADSNEKSMMFHYDASVITVLIPIAIPEGTPEEAGDLVAFPNKRPIRSSALVNAIDKALHQNPLARRAWAKLIRERQDDRNIVRLKPGNLYLFWGYRTLHANLGCKPNSLRATLLFHHGDPHSGSVMSRSIKWFRRLRESRNLRNVEG